MDMNYYQQLCARTCNYKDVYSGKESTEEAHNHLVMMSLGVAGEAGEVADLTKKVIFHGHDFDKDAFVKELGDALWYIAGAARAIGVDLDTVAQANILKLEKRYPQGFSEEASRNR